MRRPNLFRDIRLESRVSDAVDAAIQIWPGAERAWEAVEYTLAHDPEVGAPLNEAGTVRAFVFHGAQSAGIPDIQVTYRHEASLISVQDALFTQSRFPFHGTG